MKQTRLYPQLLILTVLFSHLLFSTVHSATTASEHCDWPIITSFGDQLYENDVPFRFLGLAAPNLQQNESQIRSDRSNRFPDEFEIRDILGALNRLGSRATRTFSLSVYSPLDDNMPVYISARRTYNEEAFRCLDVLLALCHDYDIRIILPFIASQSFPGIRGVDEFAALTGKSAVGAFWTDTEVKEDFQHFLAFLLNRKNTVNGILYKNDPAILAWQLGNEFGSYAGDRGLDYDEWSPRILDWSLEMAAFIKDIDPNHLIIEAGGCDRNVLIQEPNINIISEHLYEYWNRLSGRSWELAPLARETMAQCRGKKPLIVDELGLGSFDNIRDVMVTIREENIVGGLMWSIRGHRRDGGWYYHNEGGTPINSFHVPGFAAGYDYQERRFLDLLRAEAFRIRKIEMPRIQPPSPAPILFVKQNGLTWRGCTGAEFYTIERSTAPASGWQVIATGLHDSVIYNVKDFEYSQEASEALILFYDEQQTPGQTYFYRLKGENAAGASGYSNVLKVNGH